jgi:hypothetical protein
MAMVMIEGRRNEMVVVCAEVDAFTSDGRRRSHGGRRRCVVMGGSGRSGRTEEFRVNGQIFYVGISTGVKGSGNLMNGRMFYVGIGTGITRSGCMNRRPACRIQGTFKGCVGISRDASEVEAIGVGRREGRRGQR